MYLDILKILIFFLSILLPGYLCYCLLAGKGAGNRFALLFKLALAYGIGTFFIIIQIFVYLFLFKLKFNFSAFSTVYILELIMLSYFYYRYGRGKTFDKSVNADKHDYKTLIISILIIVQVILLFLNALAKPAINYDSISMWAYKSKMLYAENSAPFNQDGKYELSSGGHPNYPWLIPLIEFWMYNILGEYNDLYINFIFLAFFISMLGILYGTLKLYLDRFKSLFFVLIAATQPLVFYHGFNGYADLPLAYYCLAGISLLAVWMRSKDIRIFFLSAVFFYLANWVKLEGIIFFMAFVLVISIYSAINKVNAKKNVQLAAMVLIGAITVLPWIYFTVSNSLGASNTTAGIGFHPQVLAKFYETFFLSNNWNIWWYVFIGLFILRLRPILKNIDASIVFLFFFISLSGFLAVYLFTNNYMYAVDHTALSRNILTLLPASVMAAGICYSLGAEVGKRAVLME